MMISYSLNFEDVILMRAFSGKTNGFYIDVGASWPDTYSVTKAFYDIGWRGINVEPLLEPYNRLVADRGRDINLLCALGDASGSAQIWVPEVDGWATVHPDIIASLKTEGHRGVYHQVPLMTLCEICEEYVEADIHFLKIDVEGYEQEVLRGADFRRYRPWIVLVEATYPGTPTEVHEAWESILLEAGYGLAYVDGLNRFYVASEKPELLPSFRYPPNVFDSFKLFSQVQVEIRAAELEMSLAQQIEAAQRASQEVLQLRQHLEQLRKTVGHLELKLEQERECLEGALQHGEPVDPCENDILKTNEFRTTEVQTPLHAAEDVVDVAAGPPELGTEATGKENTIWRLRKTAEREDPKAQVPDVFAELSGATAPLPIIEEFNLLQQKVTDLYVRATSAEARAQEERRSKLELLSMADRRLEEAKKLIERNTTVHAREMKALSRNLARMTIKVETYRAQLDASNRQLNKLTSSIAGRMLIASVDAYATASGFIKEASRRFRKAGQSFHRKRSLIGIFAASKTPNPPSWLESRPKQVTDLFVSIKNSPARGKSDQSHNH